MHSESGGPVNASVWTCAISDARNPRFKSEELCALAGNDFASGRATMNPDWALTVHPEAALAARHTALVDRATLEVSLVQKRLFMA
jgi:hypothetical protein